MSSEFKEVIETVKCDRCGGISLTRIQLKLHDALVHSGQSPESFRYECVACPESHRFFNTMNDLLMGSFCGCLDEHKTRLVKKEDWCICLECGSIVSGDRMTGHIKKWHAELLKQSNQKRPTKTVGYNCRFCPNISGKKDSLGALYQHVSLYHANLIRAEPLAPAVSSNTAQSDTLHYELPPQESTLSMTDLDMGAFIPKPEQKPQYPIEAESVKIESVNKRTKTRNQSSEPKPLREFQLEGKTLSCGSCGLESKVSLSDAIARFVLSLQQDFAYPGRQQLNQAVNCIACGAVIALRMSMEVNCEPLTIASTGKMSDEKTRDDENMEPEPQNFDDDL